jgi:hypothetical protein
VFYGEKGSIIALFQVLTAMSTKVAVRCVIAPCRLVGINVPTFGISVLPPSLGRSCHSVTALVIEAVQTSETLVNLYQPVYTVLQPRR